MSIEFLPPRPYKGLNQLIPRGGREKQVNETGRGPGGTLRILLFGERKSGKTTCCLTAARMLREKGLRPGGVVCPKLLDRAGEVIGIEALNLLDDPPSREVLARTDRGMDGPSTGAYHFSEKGLRFGREALEAGARGGDVVFADELGPLEMRGEGFSNLVDLARTPSTPPMVIVVRTDLVSHVCEELAPIPATVLQFASSRPDETPARLLDLLHRFLNAT
jgi:nucleoside-triphosphatase THEP1